MHGKAALSLLLPAETMSSKRTDVLMSEFACFAGRACHCRAMYFVLGITQESSRACSKDIVVFRDNLGMLPQCDGAL